MKRKIILLLIILQMIPVLSSAQNSFYLRTNIKINKEWNNFHTKLELSNKSDDYWKIKPSIGYEFNSWLKTDIGYEFNHNYKKSNTNKINVNLTGTLRQGDFKMSLRERISRTWNTQSKEYVLRTRLLAQYSIPNSNFKPFTYIEFYYWNKLNKTKYAVGAEFNINERNSLEFKYKYTTYPNSTKTSHGIEISYLFDL